MPKRKETGEETNKSAQSKKILKSAIAALRFKHGIIYVDNSSENIDYDKVKNGNLTAKLPNLTDLTISLHNCVPITWLPILLAQCQSSLESLSLTLVDLDCLQSAGAIKFPSLKSLCLMRCIGAMDVILSGCGSKLKSLEIRHNQDQSRERNKYSHLKKDCYAMKGIDSKTLTGVKLSQLCLYDCWDARAVAAILDSSAQTLQQLILHNVYLNKVKKLDNMPMVKSAVFSLCQFDWDGGYSDINFRCWSTLENLEIKYTTNHTIKGESLPKLKSLKIEYVGPLHEIQYDNYMQSHEHCEYEDDEELRLEGYMSGLDEFLNVCPVLESLTLKGLGKPNDACQYDYHDVKPHNWDEEIEFNFKTLNLKSLIIESCTLNTQPWGLLTGLLHASSKTLETLSLVEFDIASCANSFLKLKFEKLKKMTVSLRYHQPRIRSKRLSVNRGLIYLLRASGDVLQELEIGALYDVHDLLPNTFPNVKIKLTDEQAFSKSELEIINSVFCQK